MTNIDKIKNFTHELMASLTTYLTHPYKLCEMIKCKYYNGEKYCNHGLTCKQNLIEWLKGENENELEF